MKETESGGRVGDGTPESLAELFSSGIERARAFLHYATSLKRDAISRVGSGTEGGQGIDLAHDALVEAIQEWINALTRARDHRHPPHEPNNYLGG